MTSGLRVEDREPVKRGCLAVVPAAAGQQEPCDSFSHRLTRDFLEVGEARGGIHLETIPNASGSAPQIDTGDAQLHGCRQVTAQFARGRR